MRLVPVAIARADVSQIDTCNKPDRIFLCENKLRKISGEIIDEIFARSPFLVPKGAQNRNYARSRLQVRKKYCLKFYRMLRPMIIFTGADVKRRAAQQFSADLGIAWNQTEWRFKILDGQREAVFYKIVSGSQHYPGFGCQSFGSRLVGVGKTGSARVKIYMGRHKANDLAGLCTCGIGKARSTVFGSEKGRESFSQFFRVCRVAYPGVAHLSHGAAKKFGDLFCRKASEAVIIQEEVFIESFHQILQILHIDQLARLPHEISLQVPERIAAVHVG